MEDEKPKNQDKPKNEQVRAELKGWRLAAMASLLLAVLLIGIVGILAIGLNSAQQPPAPVQYCGDYPCQPTATPMRSTLDTSGFTSSFARNLDAALTCLSPLLVIGIGFSVSTALAGFLLRNLK